MIIAQPVHGEIDVTDTRNIKSAPIPIELDGERDLLQLYFERFDVINGEGSFVFSAKSLSQSRQFAYNVHVRGEDVEKSLPLGCIQRLGAGGEEKVALRHGSSGGFYSAPNSASGKIIRHDKPTEFRQRITLTESGRYQVTLFFYDWDYESGTLLSEDPHEMSFTFEHRVPDATPSIYCALFEDCEFDQQQSSVTLLIGRTGIDARRRSATIEKKENGLWINCDDSITDVSGNIHRESAGKVVVKLIGLVPDTEYRLTIRLFDKYGSTEEYRLHLRFDE